MNLSKNHGHISGVHLSVLFSFEDIFFFVMPLR